MKYFNNMSFFVLSMLFSVLLHSAQIKVFNGNKPVSKLFFGVNSLYWIDNDATRNNPKYITALKNANVSIIRYPGGEVADNFDWMSNRLDNPNAFPYSRDKYSYIKRMDFDEFIKWKDKINAKAILVVNLEEGFIDGDLKKAAKKAAEWVRYANIEKKYHIKYWEIGNESYHLGTRYPLTAEEYAQALKLFSHEMKKVDPTIKIGANGPWDYKKVPILEYLSKQQVDRLRSLRSFKERKRLARRLRRQVRRNIQKKGWKQSWWKIVAEEAPESFDFAVIHRYTNIRKRDKDLRKPLRCDIPVFKLRNFLEELTGRNYPIALTEYNVAKRSAQGMSQISLSLTLAEMIGDYLKSGVIIANYWPMRLRDNRAMFTVNDIRKRFPYYVFDAFSTNIGNTIMEANSDDPMIYVLAGKNTEKKEFIIYLINKNNRLENIKITLPFRCKIISLVRIDKCNLQLHRVGVYGGSSYKRIHNSVLAPLSLTILKFKYL